MGSDMMGQNQEGRCEGWGWACFERVANMDVSAGSWKRDAKYSKRMMGMLARSSRSFIGK